MVEEGLEISITKIEPNIHLISVKGSLDAHTYNTLREEITNKLFNNKKYNIILNLAELDYISSAGVTVLLDTFNTAQENGGNLVLLKPQKAVRDVLELIGVNYLITIANDLSSCMANFK